MIKSLLILAVLTLLFISTHNQLCQPYYPRMFWNPSASEITPYTIDMIFMFNTNNSCPYSYIQLYDNTNIYKFRCSENKLETYNDDSSVEFISYVQKCFAYVSR